MKRLIFAIICLTAITTMATVVYCPVKYGTATRIYFSLYDSNSPWQFYETAPAAGDTYIRKSGGAAARVTNAVTDLDHTMSLLLTSTEMEANTVTIDINDQDSPALFMSETIVIPTYGHASALDVNPVADANGHYPAQIEYISAGSNAFNTSTDTVLVSSTSKNAIVSAIDANATTLLAGSTAAVAVEGRIPTALSDEGYMLSEEPNVSSLMTTGVTLANGAQGGAAAVLTLDSIVVSNSDGVGVTITGTTDGVLVTGTAGDGAHFVSSGSNGNGLTLAGNGTGADLAADSVASPTDINDAMVHGDAEWGASGGFDPNATPIMLQAADQTKLGYLTDNVATAASLTAGVAQLDAAIADVNNTLGVAGAGLTAVASAVELAQIDANVAIVVATTNGQDVNDTIMLARLTSARAGYLDNINNSALSTISPHTIMEDPNAPKALGYTSIRSSYLDWLNVEGLIAQADQIPTDFNTVGVSGDKVNANATVTLTVEDKDDIAGAVWDAMYSTYTDPNTIGYLMQFLLNLSIVP